MPDSRISALPSATSPLAGTEVLPIVQSGTTDKVTAANLLRQSGQTVTTSNPVLSLAQTWNDGAVTFTGLLFNATNTASASASMLMDLQVGGTSQFNVTRAGAVSATSGFAAGAKVLIDVGVPGLSLSSESTIAWSSTTNYFNTKDLILTRDAAQTLAQRNSTNAQVFRVYNTYTDASNYERLAIEFSSNNAFIRTQNGGTGSQRSLFFDGDDLTFRTRGTSRWTIGASTGHLLAVADNTYDIGASGATRPRSVYVGSNIVTGTQIQAGSFITAGNGTYIGITSSFFMDSASSGVVAIKNWAGTDFSRLQFGGTTSSFPALRRTGTSVEAVLADNSAYTGFNADNITAATNRAIAAGGLAGVGYKLSTTANFGVFFGSGAPTISAAQGSLYLRSDGSGTTNRMYVNTDGSTTWTAVTTVA